MNGDDKGLDSESRCCSYSCASLPYKGLVVKHSPDTVVDLAAFGLNRMFKDGIPSEEAHQHSQASLKIRNSEHSAGTVSIWRDESSSFAALNMMAAAARDSRIPSSMDPSSADGSECGARSSASAAETDC